MHQPSRTDVRRFLAGVVLPAMNEVAAEMHKRGVEAVVTEDLDGEGAVRLTVPDPSLRDFVYGVRATRRTVPTFLVSEAANAPLHVFTPQYVDKDPALKAKLASEGK